MSGRVPDATADKAYGELLDRMLAGHIERTRRAYLGDVTAFARFRGTTPAEAAAELFAGDALAARRLVLEYVIELRHAENAPATISRRLSTLRALARAAREAGIVEWVLEPPDEDEIAQAMDQLALGNVPYILPRHPGEVDRLDLQHHALREALGANYLAPIDRPRRILDVGAGTGQWGFEMCEELPGSHVVGLDLVPGKPRRPPAYHAVRANLLHGLPFADGSFDFVHQRLLFLAVPVAAWPAVVEDLVRVTGPGGWIELVEPPMRLDRAGPAISRLLDMAASANERRGLDSTSTVYRSLDAWLRGAGAESVTRREFTLPVGEWGGRVGSLMGTDFRVAFSMLGQVMVAAGAIGQEEVADLLARVQEEYARLQASAGLAVAYGRKPG